VKVRAMESACFRFLSTDSQGQTPAACLGAVHTLDGCYQHLGTAQGSCTQARASPAATPLWFLTTLPKMDTNCTASDASNNW
jgi:hypothetical protein